MAHQWANDYGPESPSREPIRVKQASKEMKQLKLGEAFQEAAQAGELHVMHMLTKEGLCDVDFPDQDGNTAFLLASAMGNVVVLRYLEQMGAKLDAANNEGWTAMHQACYHGHDEAIRVLMVLRPDLVNMPNNNGSYPLHCAVASGQYDVVRYLLIDRRAYIDARNMSGDSPLHFAVMCQEAEIAAMLVEYGAPPSAVNAQNQTPIDDAIATGQSDILRMLLSSTIRLNENDRASAEVEAAALHDAQLTTGGQHKKELNEKKKKKKGPPFSVTFAPPAIVEPKGSGKSQRKKKKKKKKQQQNKSLPKISKTPFVEVGGVRYSEATSTVAHMMTTSAVIEGRDTHAFAEKVKPTFA